MHYQIATEGPRVNEVPRDCGNWFVLWRVRYIENLDFTNLQKNNQNVRYIDGWLTVAVLFYLFFLFCCSCFCFICGATSCYPASRDRNDSFK